MGRGDKLNSDFNGGIILANFNRFSYVCQFLKIICFRGEPIKIVDFWFG